MNAFLTLKSGACGQVVKRLTFNRKVVGLMHCQVKKKKKDLIQCFELSVVQMHYTTRAPERSIRSRFEAG